MKSGVTGCLLIAAFAGATGCGGESSGSSNAGVSGGVQSCEEQFSPSAGYAWQSDGSATPLPTDDGGLTLGRTALDQVVAQCSAAGLPASKCDASRVMTREAAICIAKSSHLATGIAPWKVGLVLHHGLQSIVWNVDNTLKDDGMGTQSGDSLSIDAISGDVLQRLSWGGIP